MNFASRAAAIIGTKKPNFSPRLGLILGSGLSDIAKEIQDAVVIPYRELPGFNECTVPGHASNLYLGTWQNVPVVCMQGRLHAYEGKHNTLLQSPIRTLKLLGCDTVLITNMVGSLHNNCKPGDLALISDHINFTFFNPLVGDNDINIGERFPAMQNAYDADLRNQIKTAATKLNIALTEGVYLGTLGPSFETPAEIRAFRLLGADFVGMSAVAEVILARHCGLRVGVISVVSNMAADLSDHVLHHDMTIEWADQSIERLTQLISSSLKNVYSSEQ